MSAAAATKKKIVKKAVRTKDLLESNNCIPEAMITLDGDPLTCYTSWATNLPSETFEWVWTLFEKNMRLIFLILKNAAGDDVAYCHYRIDMDHDYAVIYCYEIQVETEYQRKGLGSIIMNVLEKLAVKLGMDKMMATVFKYNIRSLNFFRKIGFEEDETSPMEEAERDYLILSKEVSVL
uniref:N-alpha-acetyltransferase 40 n=1 Tax=Pristionchus pacificus TaxID=54126 RepID=A0A2A6BVT5_PRIPA|eukprot:PDM69978.1 Acetyltransferase [Pristionchus pacificus]